jgi:hypothetical protein
MNFLNGGAEGGEAVRCSAWLAVVFVGCFVFIGMPLGWLLTGWLLRRQAAHYLRSARVEHVSELGEGGECRIVNLLPEHRVGLALLLLKGKLLVKQLLLKGELLLEKALLKSIGQPDGEPNAYQRPSESGKQDVVSHRRVMTTANDEVSHGSAAKKL